MISLPYTVGMVVPIDENDDLKVCVAIRILKGASPKRVSVRSSLRPLAGAPVALRLNRRTGLWEHTYRSSQLRQGGNSLAIGIVLAPSAEGNQYAFGVILDQSGSDTLIHTVSNNAMQGFSLLLS